MAATAANSPTLEALGADIAVAASTLSALLKNISAPMPSLAAGGPAMYPNPSHSSGPGLQSIPAIYEMRAQLAEMAMKMFQLALGPVDTLRWIVGPAQLMSSAVLKVLEEHDIATYVPDSTSTTISPDDGREEKMSGAISFVDLAGCLDVDAELLERIMRQAFTFNLFEEGPRGYVRHTALSQALPLIKMWMHLHCRDDVQNALTSWPAAISRKKKKGTEMATTADVTTTTANSVSTKMSASQPLTLPSPWKLGNNTDKTFFAALQAEAGGMKMFSDAMRDLTRIITSDPNIFAKTFNFDWLGEGPLVDVGGGNGHIAVRIAQHHPSLKIVVQDLASNEIPARETIPSNLKNRVTFQVHDFFSPTQPQMQAHSVPPKGFFLKSILHDWPDNDCVAILRPLVPAVESGARIYIVDRSPPDSGTNPTTKDSFDISMDLLMYSLLDAKERNRSQLEHLLKTVDERLRILSFQKPITSDFAFVEVGM